MFASHRIVNAPASGFPAAGSLRSPSKKSFTVSVSVQAMPEIRTATRRRSTLYDVLKVKENASSSEIKAAYRNLAKRFHPDVVVRDDVAGNGEMFVEIHRAYSTLSDLESRKRYDVSIGVDMRRCGGRISGIDRSSGGFGTRRWETDQCW